MSHTSFLEGYVPGESLLHKLDPRSKLVTTLAFVVAVVMTPPGAWKAFGLYFLLVATLVILSRVPVFYLLKRTLVIVPFVLVIALFLPFLKPGEAAGSYNIWLWQISVSRSGLVLLGSVMVKAWLSVLSMLVLSSTTEFPALLQGLERLGLPRVMVMLFSFMYRYLFVMVEEVNRMRLARDSRNLGRKRMWQIRSVGNMIGTLFLRSYERGERIYQAMVSRGFEGEVRTMNRLRLGRADLGFAVAFLLYLAVVALASHLWL